MKDIMEIRFAAPGLLLAITVASIGPAFATPTAFSDVPSSHWPMSRLTAASRMASSPVTPMALSSLAIWYPMVPSPSCWPGHSILTSRKIVQSYAVDNFRYPCYNVSCAKTAPASRLTFAPIHARGVWVVARPLPQIQPRIFVKTTTKFVL